MQETMKSEILNIVNALSNKYTFVDNYNDYNSCIRYNPEPEWMIQILFPLDERYYITIESYHITIHLTQPISELVTNIIFDGDIPANKDNDDLDFEFIRQILKNYKSFK